MAQFPRRGNDEKKKDGQVNRHLSERPRPAALGFPHLLIRSLPRSGFPAALLHLTLIDRHPLLLLVAVEDK